MDLGTKVWITELEEKLKSKKKQAVPTKASNLSPDDFEIISTSPTGTRESRALSDAEVAFAQNKSKSAPENTLVINNTKNDKITNNVNSNSTDKQLKTKEFSKHPRTSKIHSKDKNPSHSHEENAEITHSEEVHVHFYDNTETKTNKEEEETSSVRPRRNSDEGIWQKALQKNNRVKHPSRLSKWNNNKLMVSRDRFQVFKKKQEAEWMQQQQKELYEKYAISIPLIVFLQLRIRFLHFKKKYLKKRIQVTKEIITTESSYLQVMKLLVKHFVEPLKSQENLISREDVSKIFSNVEAIIKCSETLLDRLTKSKLSNTGKVFLEMAPFFSIYTQFINNYDHANNKLKEYKESSQFTAFIRQCESEIKSELGRILDLDDLLINPIQRIPRYLLLLSELLKCTPNTHQDFKSLEQAIAKMKKVAEKVNESKRQLDGFHKLVEIQNSILPPNFLKLVEVHRKFVREGKLLKLWGSDIQEFHFFLFNDVLLYCLPQSSMNPFAKVKYKYVSFFSLENAIVEETASTIYPHAFAICYPSADKKFVLAVPTGSEKRGWISDLQKQISYRNSPAFQKTEDVADPLTPTKMRGYMKKQGTMLTHWKRRYFRLKGNSLFYYLNEEDSIPRKWITFTEKEGKKSHSLILQDKNERIFALVSVDDESKNLILCCESTEDLINWWKALQPLVKSSSESNNILEFLTQSHKIFT